MSPARAAALDAAPDVVRLLESSWFGPASPALRSAPAPSPPAGGGGGAPDAALEVLGWLARVPLPPGAGAAPPAGSAPPPPPPKRHEEQLQGLSPTTHSPPLDLAGRPRASADLPPTPTPQGSAGPSQSWMQRQWLFPAAAAAAQRPASPPRAAPPAPAEAPPPPAPPAAGPLPAARPPPPPAARAAAAAGALPSPEAAWRYKFTRKWRAARGGAHMRRVDSAASAASADDADAALDWVAAHGGAGGLQFGGRPRSRGPLPSGHPSGASLFEGDGAAPGSEAGSLALGASAPRGGGGGGAPDGGGATRGVLRAQDLARDLLRTQAALEAAARERVERSARAGGDWAGLHVDAVVLEGPTGGPPLNYAVLRVTSAAGRSRLLVRAGGGAPAGLVADARAVAAAAAREHDLEPVEVAAVGFGRLRWREGAHAHLEVAADSPRGGGHAPAPMVASLLRQALPPYCQVSTVDHFV